MMRHEVSVILSIPATKSIDYPSPDQVTGVLKKQASRSYSSVCTILFF